MAGKFYGPKGALKRIHNMIADCEAVRTPEVLRVNAQRADFALGRLADGRKKAAGHDVRNLHRKCDV